MKVLSKKTNIILAVMAVVLIAVFFVYPYVTRKTVHLGGGMFDKKTGKFYSPDDMKKLKEERENKQ
jgi:hypothetical protein